MSDDGAPVARISTSAIVANVRAAGLVAPIVDLRRDAYGHGLDATASALRAQTDAVLLVDETAELADRARTVTVGAATLAPEVVFGWHRTLPAMTLMGTVLSTKALRAGEGVSYGYIHRAPRDTRVALVTGGYAQGVVRDLGNRAHVVIGGASHPIVGRVAMDVCVVDIGDASVARGDRAVFFGDGGPRVAEWARAIGWRADEIATAVGLRARRELTS
jgi:alanine racemase